MKRIVYKMLAICISLMLLTGLLAGCGGSADPGGVSSVDGAGDAPQGEISSEPAAEPTGESTNITFSVWGTNAEISNYQDLIANYMNSHPGVTIDLTYSDGMGYHTNLQTWFSSNTVPDVFGLANDHLLMYKDSPAIADLAGQIAEDGLADLWVDGYLDAYKVGDKITAVPWQARSFAIVYNKDILDAANVSYPTNDWTDEDLYQMAQQLTSGSGEEKIYGIRFAEWAHELMMQMYGNPVYSFDDFTINAAGNAEFKTALEYFTKFIKEGLAPNELSAAVATGGFETGRFAMAICPLWDIESYQSLVGDSFAWDVVMLPMNETFDVRWKSPSRMSGFAMSENAANKEACWEFMKFLSTSEEAQDVSQRSGIPALKSIAESDTYLEDFYGGTPYDKSVYVDMLGNSTMFALAGAFAQVNDVIAVQFDLLISERTTIDDAIDTIETSGEQIFANA